jgi:hypothetical protein
MPLVFVHSVANRRGQTAADVVTDNTAEFGA